MSEPYLVKLLEKGELPHTVVGTDHSMLTEDLPAYKAKPDAECKAALDEMTAEVQRLGFWDLTMAYSIVHNACVLYSASLRDFLMRLARTGLFRACCSDQILAGYLAQLPTIAPAFRQILLDQANALQHPRPV